MDISPTVLDLGHVDYLQPPGETRPAEGSSPQSLLHPDSEFLRAVAWELGERKSGEGYTSPESHAGLAMVHPYQGFAHWRVAYPWVERTAWERRDAWDGSRPILRLYDVTAINFNGFNAHRVQDEHLPGLAGHLFFTLPHAGTWQLAEVGFLLRNGEFVPAARSAAIPFGADRPSRNGGGSALLVTGPGRVEHIDNVWDQERELRERRAPRLRHPLRIAAFAFASRPTGQQGALADFVTELAVGQRGQGHEVQVFVPATPDFKTPREQDGVLYQPLDGLPDGSPLDQAQAFASAAQEALASAAPFDLIHLHEWMTGYGAWPGDRPTVLSLSSLEVTRRGDHAGNGAITPLSREIEAVERDLVRSVRCVLTPGWLRDRAPADLGIDAGKVFPFAMEGRVPNEWEVPIDYGHVKMGFGIGPVDRVILFVGPLEHAAGVDLLVEAMPVLLRRAPNLRLAFVGQGPMHPHLQRRAHELGVGHTVQLLGHVSGTPLTNLLRSAEALILPSRFRIAMDDAVVDLARKAGRPVVTTHGGPAHLVRHEETGLVTYDNPGSMVWALDRVLGDPAHAERMGQNGRRYEGGALRWSEVARSYLELCESCFPELTVTRL